MSYIGTEPKDIRSFGRTKFDYTATQGQTAFTGADDDGKVLAFTEGQIEVYVNGILMDDSDFTTTGTGTVTLVSAANLNDVISIVSFETNIPDSNYVPASGGTFTGNVTHSGTLTASGAFTSLGIDDNATSTAMTLDSSGNVGINTNPQSKLHVYASTNTTSSTTGTTLLTLDNYVGNDLSQQKSFIDFRLYDNNTNETPQVRIGAEVGHNSDASNQEREGSGAFVVYTNNADTASGDAGSSLAERFRVDYRGYVTAPNQPTLFAYNATDVSTVSNSTKVGFASVSSWSQGITANSAKDRFTVPVAGTYLVQVQAAGGLTTANAGDGIRLAIRKNGTTYAGSDSHPIQSVGTAAGMEWAITNSMLVDLSASDYVEFQFENVDAAVFSLIYGTAYLYLLS